MGKFVRKAKVTGDVAVMDLSQTSQTTLGVRTRARAVALRHLAADAAVAAPLIDDTDSCYLELRSRKLEKQPKSQNSRKPRLRCGCKGKERPGAEECCGADLTFCSIEVDGLEIGESFGENNLYAEARERNTLEKTPCSPTRATNGVDSASLTTKLAFTSDLSESGGLNDLTNIPTELDLEEFFEYEEQSLQHFFREKYNFNFFNDSPLPGRYDWVKA